jgi:hypothetical protein
MKLALQSEGCPPLTLNSAKLHCNVAHSYACFPFHAPTIPDYPEFLPNPDFLIILTSPYVRSSSSHLCCPFALSPTCRSSCLSCPGPWSRCTLCSCSTPLRPSSTTRHARCVCVCLGMCDYALLCVCVCECVCKRRGREGAVPSSC